MATDYPLGSRRPELVSTPAGTPLAEVTLDALTTDYLHVYGINDNTQPMTATPNYLLNLNATYDVELTGTQVGLMANADLSGLAITMR